jgi:hypothetical protein
MPRHIVLALFASLVSVLLRAAPAVAGEMPLARSDADSATHGPEAPDSQFPSHHFQLEAHEPRRVQLAFHYGLLQPIVLHGFNAAVDVRTGGSSSRTRTGRDSTRHAS